MYSHDVKVHCLRVRFGKKEREMMGIHRTVYIGAFALLCASSALSADTSELRTFKAGVHKTGKYKIDKKKVFANRDLSGIACISDSHCVIASDEGVYVQVCTLSRENKMITLSGMESSKIAMLSPSVGSEIDIEAVTTIGNTYYIMGSHGVAKNSGRFLSPRHTCFRMKIDPEARSGCRQRPAPILRCGSPTARRQHRRAGR